MIVTYIMQSYNYDSWYYDDTVLILYVYYAITMPSGFPCWFLCQLLEACLSFDEEGHQDTNKEHRFEGVVDAVKPAEFLPTNVTSSRKTTPYQRDKLHEIAEILQNHAFPLI